MDRKNLDIIFIIVAISALTCFIIGYDLIGYILLGIGLVCVAVIVWKEDVDFNEHEINGLSF